MCIEARSLRAAVRPGHSGPLGVITPTLHYLPAGNSEAHGFHKIFLSLNCLTVHMSQNILRHAKPPDLLKICFTVSLECLELY